MSANEPAARLRRGLSRLRALVAADERGNAIVEFHFLAILLLVPLAYIMLAALDVQRASYGITQAAREAARVYALTGDEDRARFAADVAMQDQGVDGRADVVIDGAWQRGATVRITVSTTASLPYVPDWLAGPTRAGVPLDTTSVAIVDPYGNAP